jgi:hypothetical protein
MEHHPVLICRLKLSPAPPSLSFAKELKGWFSLLKQRDPQHWPQAELLSTKLHTL